MSVRPQTEYNNNNNTILRCAYIAAFTQLYCFYYFIRFRGLDTQRRGIIQYYYMQTIGR